MTDMVNMDIRSYTCMVLRAWYDASTCEYVTEVNGTPMRFAAGYAQKYAEHIAIQLQQMADRGMR